MEIRETRGEAATIELSLLELSALNNSLVWLRMHMHEGDFHPVLGLETQEAEELRLGLARALEDAKAQGNR
jgi:hypothetical protein